jgi:hypothetical protein
MKELRIIKTARGIEDINKAADMGFIPLVKKLKPLKKLFRTTGIFRNKKTNKIEEAEDYVVYEQYGNITSYEDENEWELVVPFHSYYPYKFDQHAAYLIPHDIEKGEKVILEDLIEDYYGGSFWSHHIRVESLQAIWAGEDFSILYDPKTDGVCNLIG